MKTTFKMILILILLTALYGWWVELNRPEHIVTEDAEHIIIRHQPHYSYAPVVVAGAGDQGMRKVGE